MRCDYFRILSWCRRSKIEHINLFFSICQKKTLLIFLFLFLVTKLYLTLCDPVDCSPPGFSVLGILQARILEWVAISFSRGSCPPRDWNCISCLADEFLTTEPPRKSINPLKGYMKWFRHHHQKRGEAGMRVHVSMGNGGKEETLLSRPMQTKGWKQAWEWLWP